MAKTFTPGCGWIGLSQTYQTPPKPPHMAILPHLVIFIHTSVWHKITYIVATCHSCASWGCRNCSCYNPPSHLPLDSSLSVQYGFWGPRGGGSKVRGGLTLPNIPNFMVEALCCYNVIEKPWTTCKFDMNIQFDMHFIQPIYYKKIVYFLKICSL